MTFSDTPPIPRPATAPEITPPDEVWGGPLPVPTDPITSDPRSWPKTPGTFQVPGWDSLPKPKPRIANSGDLQSRDVLALFQPKAAVPSTPESDARALTDKIILAGSDLARLIKLAYDTEAWKPLGYETWNDYCKTEFGFTKQRAYQLLSFVEVSRNLNSTIVDLPTHETQTRPLAHLPPDKQREVWVKANEIGCGKVTSKIVQEAVEVIAPKPEKVKRVRVTLDEGWQCWIRANTILDQISDGDASLETAMQACIEYAQKRLNKHK